MIALLVACVVLLGQTPPQHDPNLDGVLPVRTGTNGYEEYVDAAILLSGAKFMDLDAYVQSVVRGETPDHRPAVFPEGASSGALIRTLMKIAEPALAKLRQGNAKSVRYPKEISLLTLFPEAYPLKVLVRAMARAAEFEATSGPPETAALLLVDGLVFTRKFACAALIHQVMSSTCERMLLDSFRKIGAKLPTSTLPEFERVPPVPSPIKALQVAQHGVRASFDDAFAHPEELKELIFENPVIDFEGNWQEILKQFAKMPAARRDQLYDRIFKRLETPFADAIRQCRKPEIQWLDPIEEGPVLGEPPKQDATEHEVLAMLALIRMFAVLGVDDVDLGGYLTVSFERQIADRLFRMHLAILKHRAEHGAWPSSLEAVPGIAKANPDAKMPYRYRVEGDTFRLVCDTPRGPLEMGIRLKAGGGVSFPHLLRVKEPLPSGAAAQRHSLDSRLQGVVAVSPPRRASP